ncbi:MAG: RNA polymerase sigma factor [Pirellula sp.]|jgi:RNA polymerase sigma-70 factor (ECF subfamily)
MSVPVIDDYRECSLVELIERAKSDDRQAMDEICLRFDRQVFAIAYRRLENWDEALELKQDVFIQAFRKLDQLETPEAFPGWLRQIVVRMAINRASRRRRVASVDAEILETTMGCEHDPSREVIADETRQQVQRGLSELKKLDRETLVAFYFERQSLIEMSENFAAPVGTIKRRLHTARKRLAEVCGDLMAV